MAMRPRRENLMGALLAGVILLAAAAAPAAIKTTTENNPSLEARISSASWNLALGDGPRAEAGAAFLTARGKQDILATLVLVMRYNAATEKYALEAFNKLTGGAVKGWPEAQLWLEAHPEIKPHNSYRVLKLYMVSNIDPHFLQFLGGARSDPDKMKIRLEEIVWGGVRVDGIPSLDGPDMIAADAADYLRPQDPVFGVAINGDARAYPLRIMGWHEMFNDVIGGVPVALAYCTLCGSGILYETKLDRYAEPLLFGSSGFLYRSNKLMFDRHTFSLWNQFTGRPVTGPLVDSGIELKVRPVTITNWSDWRRKHPKTQVLSLETGHERDYSPGAVYGHYFASRDLMFPARVRQNRVQQKDYVFGIRTPEDNKAWPLHHFTRGRVINDTVGGRSVTLIGNAETRTVRAYFTRGETFKKGLGPDSLDGPGGLWQIGELHLTGPKGEHYARAAGGISFWFAWDNYLGRDSDLYEPTD